MNGVRGCWRRGTVTCNERNRHVYELFLVRPVKRRELLLAKGLAVYSCVAVACLVSVIVGLVADLVVVADGRKQRRLLPRFWRRRRHTGIGTQADGRRRALDEV